MLRTRPINAGVYRHFMISSHLPGDLRGPQISGEPYPRTVMLSLIRWPNLDPIAHSLCLGSSPCGPSSDSSEAGWDQ